MAKYKLEPIVSECLLVSFDFTRGKDVGVAVVGRRFGVDGTEIVNAFQGEEAWELYKKLTTVNKKEGTDDGGRKEV